MVSTSTSNSNSTMAVLTTLLDIGPTSPLPFNTSKELLARWSAGPCAHRDCKYAHPRECYSCDALFCPEHKKDASCHPCVLLKSINYNSRDRKRYEDLINDVMSSSLKSRVLALRPKATRCDFPRPKIPDDIHMGDEDRKRGRTDWVAGNTNLHFLLTFNDGGKDMLARVRFTRDSLWAWHSPVANEFETLQVVHSIIPKWSSKSWLLDEFIILERKEGQPWFADKYNPNWQRTVKDIAQLSVKFAKKTFTGGVGSFMPGTLVAGGQPSIGSIRLFDCGPSGYGPFQTPAQLHLDRIDLFLAGHYAHSLPIDKKSHEVYLAHLELRDLIAKNVEMNTAPPASYIKHADDKGDHWLIREDGSLSAIIDWEFTYITSFAEAFASPRPFFDEESDKHGLSSKELDLRNAYMSLGRSDLAAAVDGSAKYHLIGTIVFQPSHNTKLRRRVRRAFVGDAEGLDPASPDQWVAAAYLRYGQHHPGFQRLLNNHPMGSSWKEQLDKSLDRAAKELKGEIPVGSWNPE